MKIEKIRFTTWKNFLDNQPKILAPKSVLYVWNTKLIPIEIYNLVYIMELKYIKLLESSTKMRIKDKIFWQ